MTENEELKIISDSLLKFLIHENNLLSKSVFEISAIHQKQEKFTSSKK